MCGVGRAVGEGRGGGTSGWCIAVMSATIPTQFLHNDRTDEATRLDNLLPSSVLDMKSPLTAVPRETMSLSICKQ